jgi:serine/tyrosine/threonine adenylyltransferase
MRLGLTHSYAELPARFYTALAPTPVREPSLVVFNRPLATELGLDVDAVEREGAALFSGNTLPEDARPIAMAYAGHQFGGFVPRLGDGRAILLGELAGPDGSLRDLQLKGSGRTPWSRSADGRAALGPMLREYLISEAMHALGIPTTRSLAVVTTGEWVRRDDALPGAILTRVAASHVRVGTFEYFAAREDTDGVRSLMDYVISRHYPDAREAAVPALALLEAVADRQARLVAQWMQVGFIHGVMNTDNMAVSGETIDYGPCAFMDSFDPRTVFSSIDHQGRYAFANQPTIAQWNLARLAETLLPLIDADTDRAVSLALEIIEPFITRFDAYYLARMRARLGVVTPEDGDPALIRRLLGLLQDAKADYTLALRHLADAAEGPQHEGALRSLFSPAQDIDGWIKDWRARLARDRPADTQRASAMRAVSPAFIPRNHQVEVALAAASDHGDFGPFRTLLRVLRRPYEDQPAHGAYLKPPLPSERVLQTFCGT